MYAQAQNITAALQSTVTDSDTYTIVDAHT